MNKKTKKRIIGLALVFALFAVIASGTLAYFTDETEVATNSFTVGKVQIRLSETLVDADGLEKDTVAKADATTKYKNHTVTDGEGEVWDTAGETLIGTRTDLGNFDGNEKATKVVGYDGKNYGYSLMPGKTVDKDPVVTVLQNSEDSYVRVKVTLDHAKSSFLPAFVKHVKAGDIEFSGTASVDNIATAIAAVKTFFVGYDEKLWAPVDAVVEGEKITVTFNYVGTTIGENVEGGAAGVDVIVPKNDEGNTNLEPVITAVTLPTWVDSEDGELFETKTDGTVSSVGFSVDVVAQAIQAAGFDTAEEAWAAFDGQNTVTEPQQ